MEMSAQKSENSSGLDTLVRFGLLTRSGSPRSGGVVPKSNDEAAAKKKVDNQRKKNPGTPAIDVDPFAPKITLRRSPVEVLGELGIAGTAGSGAKEEEENAAFDGDEESSSASADDEIETRKKTTKRKNCGYNLSPELGKETALKRLVIPSNLPGGLLKAENCLLKQRVAELEEERETQQGIMERNVALLEEYCQELQKVRKELIEVRHQQEGREDDGAQRVQEDRWKHQLEEQQQQIAKQQTEIAWLRQQIQLLNKREQPSEEPQQTQVPQQVQQQMQQQGQTQMRKKKRRKRKREMAGQQQRQSVNTDTQQPQPTQQLVGQEVPSEVQIEMLQQRWQERQEAFQRILTDPSEETVRMDTESSERQNADKVHTGETWSQVVSKRRRKEVSKAARSQSRSALRDEKKEALLKRRQPQGGAIIIRKISDEGSYTDLILKAKQKVAPGVHNLTIQKTRFTKKGEMILEIRGEDEKISTFASQLQQALAEEAEVRQPKRTTMLLLLDLEATTTKAEIANAVGGGDVKITRLEDMGRGLKKAVVMVPIVAALEVLKKKSVQIGWSWCRVRSLEREQNNQPRCFKCLQVGHMARGCNNEEMGKICYRCGGADHLIRECHQEPKCPLCSRTQGKDAKHILGGKGCLGAIEDRSKPRRVPQRRK